MFLKLTIGILLASTMALAADPKPSERDEKDCKSRPVQKDADIPAATKTALYNKCIEIKVNQMKINQANGAIANLENTSENCVKEVTTVKRRFWFDGSRQATAEELRACADKVAKAKADQESLVRSLEQQKTQLEQAEVQMTVGSSNATQEADAQRQAVKDMKIQAEFNTMKLSALELLRDGDKGVAKLNRMAQAIDNSALGIYMRDRMAGVMSSPAMCAAVKSCPTPAKISGKDLNSVFNSKMETTAEDIPKASVPAPASKGGTTK